MHSCGNCHFFAGGGVRSGNRYSYGNGEKRPQSFRTGRQQVKYLPYSPSHGKWISDDSAPFADMDTIDRFAGEDLTGERLLSRHPRQTVKTRRLMTELVDPEEEEQEQVPIKPKRVAKKKMEKSVFAYDVDVAYGGGLKGESFGNIIRNLSRQHISRCQYFLDRVLHTCAKHN